MKKKSYAICYRRFLKITWNFKKWSPFIESPRDTAGKWKRKPQLQLDPLEARKINSGRLVIIKRFSKILNEDSRNIQIPQTNSSPFSFTTPKERNIMKLTACSWSLIHNCTDFSIRLAWNYFCFTWLSSSPWQAHQMSAQVTLTEGTTSNSRACILSNYLIARRLSTWFILTISTLART